MEEHDKIKEKIIYVNHLHMKGDDWRISSKYDRRNSTHGRGAESSQHKSTVIH